MQEKYFNKNIVFNEAGGYYDNQPSFSAFYEKNYLQLNPDLHSADSEEKIESIIRVLDYAFDRLNFKPTKIIDVGSGSLKVLRGILDYLGKSSEVAPQGLAVDISGSILRESPLYVDICKIRADATDLPITDRYFDLLLMIDLLEHSARPSDLLSEALRVSKYVLVKVPLERALYTMLRGGSARLEHLEKKFGHIQHFNRMDVMAVLGSQMKLLYESYEIIPNRSYITDLFQKSLIKFKIFPVYRWLFGGFIVLLIKAE